MLKYIDEFRSAQTIEKIARLINSSLPSYPINFMEVCGGHTVTIKKFNIESFLPDNLQLISGPGCPVCVTSPKYIDYAIELSQLPNVIVATFGDLMRVPGSKKSLISVQNSTNNIRICYSPFDALQFAIANPNQSVIFLAIGFETTAPLIAACVLNAQKQQLKNLFILSALKTMPPVMKKLLDAGEIKINGFICPGHVSTITGSRIYDFIAREYKIPCVISGFEPFDVMVSIYHLVKMVSESKAEVINQYKRVVKIQGNLKAQQLIKEVFEPCDAEWRGLGIIPDSGLKLNKKYSQFDAELAFPIEIKSPSDNSNCICGDILKGVKKPTQCPLFGKVCSPESPQGACMVSSEGTCATYYKYRFQDGR